MITSDHNKRRLPEPEPYALRVDMPKRVVVIGDLNGHHRLFDDLLFGTGLIDKCGNWSGGDTYLVQMGDVVNRGGGSRAAAERLIGLRPQARAQDGEVIWLLGNHEVMTAFGHEGYVTAEEYMEFAEIAEIEAFYEARTKFQFEVLSSSQSPRWIEPIGGWLRAWEESHAPGKAAFRRAFSKDGVFGQHIRSLPIAIVMGRLLFTHGGLTPAWAQLGLSGLQDAAQSIWRDEVLGYSHLAPSSVFRDPSGPLWHRTYCISDASVVREDVKRATQLLNVERMVVGHTRTDSAPGGQLGVPLLRQEGRVLMVDVGIGDPGEPGCAAIIENGLIDMWSPIHGRRTICSLEQSASYNSTMQSNQLK